MEHHGLILSVLSLILLSVVNASSQGQDTDSEEREIVYQANNYKCPFPFGTFSDPSDCSHFYVCMGGIAMHKKCPWLTKFCTWRRRCVPSMIAVCDDNKEENFTDEPEPVTEAPTRKPETPFKCPNFWGTYPNPDDCSKYYTCSFFRHSQKTCPENQLFDAATSECKPANEVNCGDRENPLRLLTTAVPTETDVATDEDTETVSDVTTETDTETAPDVVTDADTETAPDVVTDADKEVSTEETTLEDITTTPDFPTGPPEHDCNEDDLDCIIDETGDVDHWFICPQDVGSYPHPSSDKLFIFCMNWIPSAKKCGHNLVFSRELSTCIEDKFL